MSHIEHSILLISGRGRVAHHMSITPSDKFLERLPEILFDDDMVGTVISRLGRPMSCTPLHYASPADTSVAASEWVHLHGLDHRHTTRTSTRMLVRTMLDMWPRGQNFGIPYAQFIFNLNYTQATAADCVRAILIAIACSVIALYDDESGQLCVWCLPSEHRTSVPVNLLNISVTPYEGVTCELATQFDQCVRRFRTMKHRAPEEIAEVRSELSRLRGEILVKTKIQDIIDARESTYGIVVERAPEPPTRAPSPVVPQQPELPCSNWLAYQMRHGSDSCPDPMLSQIPDVVMVSLQMSGEQVDYHACAPTSDGEREVINAWCDSFFEASAFDPNTGLHEWVCTPPVMPIYGECDEDFEIRSNIAARSFNAQRRNKTNTHDTDVDMGVTTR